MWKIPRIYAMAAAVVLMLAGCVPSGVDGVADPTPRATPVFASEEEALAAATAAYAAYVKVSDEILMDGGAHPERIDAVATGEARNDALAGYQEFREKQFTSTGNSSIYTKTIQSFDSKSLKKIAMISIYICLDVSKVDVVDPAGISVVSTSRPSLQAFEVSLDWDSKLEKLQVASRDPWSEPGVCP